MITISAADLKTRLSEFLGRVTYNHEKFVITRRGKPVAQLSPIGQMPQHLGQMKGWMEDSDPLFGILDQIAADRDKHLPRIQDAGAK
jgi:prevent-host-death family protein